MSLDDNIQNKQASLQKRKQSPSSFLPTTKKSYNRPQPTNRRAKSFNARTLAVQSTDPALSSTGELDVSAYLAARSFEIRALEKGIIDSKHVNSQRAFQKVPRSLRRRTASHNVKRVPKRLRKRAAWECIGILADSFVDNRGGVILYVTQMLEDNTPLKKKKRANTRLQHIRLDTARRLHYKNTRFKARRQSRRAPPLDDTTTREAQSVGLKPSEYFEIAPRVPKIKKNQLSHPPRPSSSSMVRYAKRQSDKTWLPTHIWHAKRAHMTNSTKWSHRRLGKVIRSSKNAVTNPGNKYCTGGVDGALWRFAMPLAPTEKCYRNMHRNVGMRGAVVWDASYFSTIAMGGTLESVHQVLGAIGVDGKGTNRKKWLAGKRSWTGWVFEKEESDIHKPIAPVTVVWCAEYERNKDGDKHEDVEMTDAAARSESKPPVTKSPKSVRRKLFIRIHPSAFLQLWTQLLPLCHSQKPQVMLEDLRYEIGSIDIMGPGATEALLDALKPIDTTDESSCEYTWSKLSPALTNPASLPPNTVLGFNISDPRLHFPPKKSSKKNLLPKQNEQEELTRLLAFWPPDNNMKPADLFDRRKRLSALRRLLSQKAINRRQAHAGPGKYPEPREADPQIPILLLVHRNSPSSCFNPASSLSASSTGSYSILAPWRFIIPIFQYLVSYPLSTGNTPSFAGLNQQRQIAFETGAAWFPGDFPGTKA
ncbi:hypothetical protein KEM54_004175, partial [Ascosphaera aggregata]